MCPATTYTRPRFSATKSLPSGAKARAVTSLQSPEGATWMATKPGGKVRASAGGAAPAKTRKAAAPRRGPATRAFAIRTLLGFADSNSTSSSLFHRGKATLRAPGGVVKKGLGTDPWAAGERGRASWGSLRTEASGRWSGAHAAQPDRIGRVGAAVRRGLDGDGGAGGERVDAERVPLAPAHRLVGQHARGPAVVRDAIRCL